MSDLLDGNFLDGQFFGDEGMGPREPLHQPASAADLRLAPPACRECALVRGQLRDFVDGDLDGEHHRRERNAIELHVHGCRTCALAMARAEHEVLRLRRAFAVQAAVEGTSASPSSDFAARVRQRLVLDETSLLSREALARAAAAARSLASRDTASGDAARNVARRGARFASGRFVPGREVRSATLASRLIAGGLVLLVAIALAVTFAEVAADHPERGGRLVLMAAIDTYGDSGERRSVGQGLGDHQTLVTGPRGKATADWHDASAKNQPAATLTVDGNGTVRVENGGPVLVSGAMQVVTRRPVSIPVADGSRLDLGIGEYLLAAESLASKDAHWNALSGAPADLRVTLTVLSGQAATVVRGTAATPVPFGSVGIYRGNTPVDVQANPTLPHDPGSTLRRPDPAVPGDPREVLFTGQVYERSGAGAVGANVNLSFASRGGARSANAVVGSGGQFSLSTGPAGSAEACDSPFAIVQVFPPANRLGLGLTAPNAYRLNYQNGNPRLAEAVVLDYATDLTGVVVDESGMPYAGVRVVPCLIDELFGTVLPWPQGQVTTGEQGALRLPQLPVSLPRHQYLAVLLLHPDLEPTVVAVPQRGSAAARAGAAVFVAPRLRTVQMHGFQPSVTFQLFEDLTGLPPGSAAAVYTVTTDAQGYARDVQVGRGRLWRRNANLWSPMLVPLVQVEHEGALSYRQLGAPQPLATVFQPLQPLSDTSLLVATSARHQVYATAAAAVTAAGSQLTVIDALSGHAGQYAQVFATRPSGTARSPASVRFLGFTSASGSLPLDLQAGENGVFAIGSDGSTGWLGETALAAQSRTLALVANGEVLLGAALRPEPGLGEEEIVTIRFERVSAPLPGVWCCAYRFACAAEGWTVRDLPPGEYRAVIDGHAHPIEVPSSSTAILQ